jgi:dTDP-4-dehydrorhamnose 3,5-epimerase
VDQVEARPGPDCGIRGIVAQTLPVLPAEGGDVLRMLRSDHPLFSGFGEVYFSEVLPGAVKAWKLHRRQTQHLAVPVGRVLFAVYDPRPDSPTFDKVREYILGRPDSYCLLRIPPGLWYGFTALGKKTALLCNCADMPHDPAESERKPPDTPDIPYTFCNRQR